MNNLIYNVEDKPSLKIAFLLGLQQVLAILSATITVPMIIGNDMDPAAAIFGAGIGTLIYLFFTKRKSPVFLGSSFAFIGSMLAAFAGAITIEVGYAGLIIGALFAGLVYILIAMAVKIFGTHWIDTLMPPVVIGPTVAIIGLSLAGSAITNLTSAGYLGILTGIISLFIAITASVYGNKAMRMIPFMIGIIGGYIIALIITLNGYPIIDLAPFSQMKIISIPRFTFLKAFGGFNQLTPGYIGTIISAYVPVAFVVFAEHIADHRNLSTIIGKDLIKDPGLHRTLLGDGIGSIGGAIFGGCPNTTYGESIACVAITKNASTYTILITAIECIILSFIGPISTLISSIPACVMGGIIMGIGGFTLTIGSFTLTTVACALILGIITNRLLHN